MRRILLLIVALAIASLAAPSMATRTPLPSVDETSPLALESASWLLPDAALFEQRRATEPAGSASCQGIRVLETCVRVSTFARPPQPPANQRFRAEIAVGVVSGPSMYQFSLNNPVSYSDPLGLNSGRSDYSQTPISDKQALINSGRPRISPEGAAKLKERASRSAYFGGLQVDAANRAIVRSPLTFSEGIRFLAELPSLVIDCIAYAEYCGPDIVEAIERYDFGDDWDAYVDAPIEQHATAWGTALGDTVVGGVAGAHLFTGLRPTTRLPTPASEMTKGVRRTGTPRHAVQEVLMEDLTPLHPVPRPDVPPEHISNIAELITDSGYDLGQAVPVFRMPSGELVSAGGHHRVAAMKRLGESHIPARIVDWDSLSESVQARWIKRFPEVLSEHQ